MTRLDTLRLLLKAEIPTDLATIEASATEIARRIDEVDPTHLMYDMAHARLDALLVARADAIAREQRTTSS